MLHTHTRARAPAVVLDVYKRQGYRQRCVCVAKTFKWTSTTAGARARVCVCNIGYECINDLREYNLKLHSTNPLSMYGVCPQNPLSKMYCTYIG